MKTILLIEDHAPLRENLSDMLMLEGFTVLRAADGRSGLAIAKEQRPDLILCDIMLPGMDGHEVLMHVRRDAAMRAVPFVFLTAKGTPPDIREGMNLGADDYLPKPVSRSDLLNAVRTRLARAAQTKQSFAPRFDDSVPLEKLGISPREAEVLLWMAQGKGNHEIAAILELSPATVKKHTIHIFEKLGVENRTAAMLKAMEALA